MPCPIISTLAQRVAYTDAFLRVCVAPVNSFRSQSLVHMRGTLYALIYKKKKKKERHIYVHIYICVSRILPASDYCASSCGRSSVISRPSSRI